MALVTLGGTIGEKMRLSEKIELAILLLCYSECNEE